MSQERTSGRNGRVHEVREGAGESPATKLAERTIVCVASASFEIMIPPLPAPRSIKTIPQKTISKNNFLKTISSTGQTGRGAELLKESEERKGRFEETSRPTEGCRENFPNEMAATSFNDRSSGEAIGIPKAKPRGRGESRKGSHCRSAKPSRETLSSPHWRLRHDFQVFWLCI